MGIDSTVAEQFSPDRTRKRLILECSASAGGDIITPIFTSLREHCVCMTVRNSGANALTSLEVWVDVAPEMGGPVSVLAEEGLWRASDGIATLAAGAVGVLWIERPLGAYYAVRVTGDGDLDVIMDIGAFYAYPAN